VDNIVNNLFAKFDDDRLWDEEKFLVIWKSDNKNPNNKNKNKKNIRTAIGDPFPGPGQKC